MKAYKSAGLFALCMILSISMFGCSLLQTKKPDGDVLSSSSSDESDLSSTSNESNAVNRAVSSSDVMSQASGSPAVLSSSSQGLDAAASYLGKWVVVKLVYSNPRGSTYDSNDINKILGQELTFTLETATCFADKIEYLGRQIQNPNYTLQVLTDSELNSLYRASFKALGISTDSVTEVSVSDKENIGVDFLVIDQNTLSLFGGGDFFQLKRVN